MGGKGRRREEGSKEGEKGSIIIQFMRITKSVLIK